MYLVKNRAYPVVVARESGWTFTVESFGRDGRVWGILSKPLKNGDAFRKRYGSSRSYIEHLIAMGSVDESTAVAMDRLHFIRAVHA